MHGQSLGGRLATFLSLGFGAFWVLAAIIMAVVLKFEQEEMRDLTLRETAELLQPLLVERHAMAEAGTVTTMPAPLEDDEHEDEDEALIYFLMTLDGDVLLRSATATAVEVPESPAVPGYSTTQRHVLYTTQADDRGIVLVFGDPLHERWEAYRDSFLAFLLPMIAFLPVAYLLVILIARLALRPLDQLGSDIASRGLGRLEPIEQHGQPKELATMIETLNGLMRRLGQAIEGERAFATNAAHELRTPVAVALAQTQRLRAVAAETDKPRIIRIETALQRMSKLVESLLHLARSDAGLGASSDPQDIRHILDFVLEESRIDPKRASRLHETLPPHPVMAFIDADAYAILARNLIENGFQHAHDASEISVELTPEAELRVANQSVSMSDDELSRLKQRFERGRVKGSGFGLGLHIADAIARQSGGELGLRSLPDGTFEARFRAAV